LVELALPKVECVESADTYGRFVAEPLERGFGVTLGNTLRRVLLSSLAGAAVTWVQIRGIQHEFSVIPHVKEDAVDFLLNVKLLRLRSLSQQPGRLILDVEGEGEVHAADIKPSADFEIINPELSLATLDSPEANLYVEFNVELGRGYIPSGSSSGLPIGVIPVDAVFTPVHKVNFSVEPTQRGQEDGREKLVLEVWTDGTLSSAEAVSQSAAILIEQFSCFKEPARLLGEGTEFPWRLSISPEQYNMPLEQLGLSTRSYNSLRRGGISTLGELLERSAQGLPCLSGFGAKSQREVIEILESFGLSVIPQTKAKKGEAADWEVGDET